MTRFSAKRNEYRNRTQGHNKATRLDLADIIQPSGAFSLVNWQASTHKLALFILCKLKI
jgi:hypothetical protein